MMFRRLSSRLAAGLLLAARLPLAACGGGAKDRPKADLAASKITTIGVNSYLWRASLDTLSFMPMVQTDSNGGVIVTDWYINPNSPNERMKLTVSILDQDRSEEHTSELQSLMRISYAVFCLNKKNNKKYT